MTYAIAEAPEHSARNRREAEARGIRTEGCDYLIYLDESVVGISVKSGLDTRLSAPVERTESATSPSSNRKASAEPRVVSKTPAERMRLLASWISDQPAGLPILPPEAFERESIYERP